MKILNYRDRLNLLEKEISNYFRFFTAFVNDTVIKKVDLQIERDMWLFMPGTIDLERSYKDENNLL